jgi:hypothetical protein
VRYSAARETNTRATNGCSVAAQGLPAAIGALELATVAVDGSTPCPRGTLRRVAGAQASLKDTCIALTRALLARSLRASRNAPSHPHRPDNVQLHSLCLLPGARGRPRGRAPCDTVRGVSPSRRFVSAPREADAHDDVGKVCRGARHRAGRDEQMRMEGRIVMRHAGGGAAAHKPAHAAARLD